MELSDDEIKAIERVKEAIRIDKEQRIVTIYDEKPLLRDRLQTLIDLINKQQEKIVDLETKLAIETIDNKYNQEERDEETIPRYKIRDILNYLDNTDLNNYEVVMAFKKMMKELLEDGDHIPRID